MGHRILILSKYQKVQLVDVKLFSASLHLIAHTTHHTITATQVSTLYAVHNKYQGHAHS